MPPQAVASAILAPSLRHVADSLALSWRRQLTAAAHKRYLAHNNFYTVSQLAGMQARPPACCTSSLLCIYILCMFPLCVPISLDC